MNNLDKERENYPRVTEIIGKQTIEAMDCIPPAVLANACLRGTMVHGYCTAYAEGLYVSGIEQEYEEYYKAFTKWYDQNVKNLVIASKRLYDDNLKFSGEFDMIVEMKSGAKALLDIKTSYAKSKTWPIQLAAYDHLCNLACLEYDEVFILHLKRKEGESNHKNSLPTIEAVRQTHNCLNTSWDIFESALKCYDYFHRKERK